MDWHSELQPNMQPRRQDLWKFMIEAILESIYLRGYAATTVSHITDRLEVNRTQFYFLFQDKHGCFLAAQDAVFNEIEHRIVKSRPKGAGWLEAARSAIECVLGLFDEEPAFARLALIESPMVGPQAQKRQSEARKRLLPHIDAGRELGPGDGVLPESIAEMALGSSIALVEMQLRANGKPSFSPLAPQVLFAILMPFVGPVEASKLVADQYPEAGFGDQS